MTELEKEAELALIADLIKQSPSDGALVKQWEIAARAGLVMMCPHDRYECVRKLAEFTMQDGTIAPEVATDDMILAGSIADHEWGASDSTENGIAVIYRAMIKQSQAAQYLQAVDKGLIVDERV